MAISIEWSESPAPNAALREHIKNWLTANLADHPATATRQRHTARSLVEAIECDGLDYEHLPEDFLAKHWFPKHGGAHRVTQNVLVSSAGKVLDYLHEQGVDVPRQIRPDMAKPPSRVKKEKAAKVAARAAVVDVEPTEEEESPQPVIAQPPAPRPPPTPVVTPVVKRASPAPVVAMPHPTHPLPPIEEPPMPSAFTFPEAPAPSQVDPRRGKINPVAALIPPENRLRIYKKGAPGDLDSHLIDMPSALVARYGSGSGAVTTILNDVVRPRWGPRPGERSVYRFVQVSPQGAEGNATEVALEGENTMPAPGMQPLSPPAPAGYDQLAMLQQQAQAQLEALQQIQQQRGPGVDPQLDANLRALQEQVTAIQQHLSARPSGPGDFGTAALGAVTAMADKILANKPLPITDKQPSMMELLQYAQQQADRQRTSDREFYAMMFKKEEPKTDPMLLGLLERMDSRLAALEEDDGNDEPAAVDDGLGGIKKFMETAEFLKKHMGIEAGPTMRAKEPENVLGLLRELAQQVPAIIAEYRQTVPVIAAARLGMVDTVQVAVGPDGKPVAKQLPAQTGTAPLTAEQQQAAVRARLPAEVKEAVERLLSATTDEQVGDAVGALVRQMEKRAENSPQALAAFKSLEQDSVSGNLEGTVRRLRQIFVFFGYNAEAPVPKVVELSKTVIRLMKALNDRKAPAAAAASSAPSVTPAAATAPAAPTAAPAVVTGQQTPNPQAPNPAPALHVVTAADSKPTVAQEDVGPHAEGAEPDEEGDNDGGEGEDEEESDEDEESEEEGEEEAEEPAATSIVAPKNGSAAKATQAPAAALTKPAKNLDLTDL